MDQFMEGIHEMSSEKQIREFPKTRPASLPDEISALDYEARYYQLLKEHTSIKARWEKIDARLEELQKMIDEGDLTRRAAQNELEYLQREYHREQSKWDQDLDGSTPW